MDSGGWEGVVGEQGRGFKVLSQFKEEFFHNASSLKPKHAATQIRELSTSGIDKVEANWPPGRDVAA